MTNFHLILNNQSLGIDTKIVFRSGFGSEAVECPLFPWLCPFMLIKLILKIPKCHNYVSDSFAQPGIHTAHFCNTIPVHKPLPDSLWVLLADKLKNMTWVGRHIGFMMISNGHTLLISIWVFIDNNVYVESPKSSSKMIWFQNY